MKGIFIMKKIISLILSVMLCIVCSFGAFAVEETTGAAPAQTPSQTQAQTQVQTTAASQLVAADDATAESAFRLFEKIIVAESEAKTADAGEAMFSLYSLFKEAGVTDYVALSNQMQKYAQDTGSEIAPCFSAMNCVQAIVRIFMTNGAFDLIKIQSGIESSNSLATLLALYTGAEIVKAPQPTAAAQPGKTTMVENPRTGDSSVNTAIAFAVLGLGVAAIAVCAKKKES